LTFTTSWNSKRRMQSAAQRIVDQVSDLRCTLELRM
jgi:hypothetical protein